MIEGLVSLVLENGMSSERIAKRLSGEDDNLISLNNGEIKTKNLRLHVASIRGRFLDVTREGPYLERAKKFWKLA